MILSDRSIREALEAGRVVIEPLDDDAIQPSSVDVRVDDSFRVFANHRHPYIDVRRPMPDLTELVKVGDDEPFILHPGEVVGQHLRALGAARRPRRAPGGQELARPAGPADPPRSSWRGGDSFMARAVGIDGDLALAAPS